MDIITRFRLLPLLVPLLPFNAGAVLVEFESTCNNDVPFVSGSSGNCTLLGLSSVARVRIHLVKVPAGW